jgi:aspartate kinase
MFYWLSLQWENHDALEVVIKDYFDKSSALQSSVQVKYHNQVLLDLFEDDTNAALQSKRSLLILTIFCTLNPKL